MRKSLLMAALAAAVVGLSFGEGDGTQVKPVPAIVVPDTVASADDTAAPADDKATTFTDTRDGQVYRIVKIGRQYWFAENLNYAAKGSKCYENKNANCARYGRLYDWNTAMKACPAGTHLSSSKEWETLVNYAGGEDIAGKRLKSTRDWYYYSEKKFNNGTDNYGFTALPCGQFDNSDGDFSYDGTRGFWWSASRESAWNPQCGCSVRTKKEESKRQPIYWYIEYERHLIGGAISPDRSDHFSVRCVLDESDVSNKEGEQ